MGASHLEIEINGETRIVPDQVTIEGLVRHLGLQAERIAVERNREVVVRTEWQMIVVEKNDQIEIIHFVGGGRSQIVMPELPLDEN